MARRSLRWLQLRVGLLIVVALTTLAFGIFFVGQIGVVYGARYRLVTLMPSASGLVDGALVRLGGQDVGKVAAIEFVPFAERRGPEDILRITLEIDRSVQEQIRTDSEARLLTQGLLGDKVIDIRPGTLHGAPLAEGDTLVSARPVDLEQLLRSASDALGNAVVLLSDFREIADALLRGQGTAGRILADDDLYLSFLGASRAMSSFLRSLQGGEGGEGGGTLGRLVRDSMLYVELRSAVASLDTVTQAIVDGRGTLGRLIWSDTLYTRLVHTSLRADSILKRLESGEGTAGMLLQDPELYENLNKLAVDLQAVLAEFRAQPRRYLPPITIF